MKLNFLMMGIENEDLLSFISFWKIQRLYIMVEHTEALKTIFKKGFGVVKFFKTFEYSSFQRDLAEKDLRQALESVSLENSELSSKAQEWLRDFDIIICGTVLELNSSE
ncbi:hypothetical protein Glove_152g13 [Diversispora epigaea]|uniref:Uncharacterized protein n=1 Tax=Diversispora epigaea TaxID=1348612 RepID=A0A397IWF8_9GLOM|nr:hypothetical protein Glove_152g13 [Diversispora epigaea]